MSVRSDPSFYGSDFERNANDAYYTEAAVCMAVAKWLRTRALRVWEPCCGRGDLAGILYAKGMSPLMSDIDISAVDPRARKLKIPVEQHDFLNDKKLPSFVIGAASNVDAIVTNPPFGDNAEKVIRQALTFSNVRCFAFLLRSEWDHASTRLDLFREQPFAGEIVLTWRPRWDWWLTPEQKREERIKANAVRVAHGKKAKSLDEPDAGPRHNFKWFLWDREHKGPPVKLYATRGESTHA